MAAQFWDLPHGVIREDAEIGDDHYGWNSNHHNTFSQDSSWLWSSESYDSRPSGLLFDHQPEQGFLSHKLIHSEPVSPSSVATTPTTSEHPVVAPSRQTSSQYAADYEDAQVSHIHVSKKLRKSTPSTSHASVERSSGDRNGRKKKYDAPPGVWRNSGGFISTVYINKKRVYGPLRRDVQDAVKDREEMLMAKQVINTEEGMRAFVQGMKERSGSNRQLLTSAELPSALATAAQSSSVVGTMSGHSFNSQNSVSTIRVSSRPMREAAKRNLFAGYSSQSAGESEEEETQHDEEDLVERQQLDHDFTFPSTTFF